MSTVALDADKARFNMIEQQIRPWEVLDSRVLSLLGELRREDFVPAAHRALAFADLEIPLSHPMQDGQCMLAPRVEARMLQELALAPTDRVLEIGTGSGYMAALLGRMAREVISVEMDADLATTARAHLHKAGVMNVQVLHADACAGDFAACRGGAPYDAIVLSGSVAEVPAALLDMLAPGGRLLAVVGHEPMMRATLITRSGPASFLTSQPWDTVAPRLQNFPEPSRFTF